MSVPRPRWGFAAAAISAVVLLGALSLSLLYVGQGQDSTAATATTTPATSSTGVVDWSGRPLRFLVVGDSLAGTLAIGLAQEASRYHAEVINEGRTGCALSFDGLRRVLWYQDLAPSAPCKLNDPSALISSWQRWIDQWNPDVVLYFSRSELFDQQVHGTWTNLGTPLFDTWLKDRLDLAVSTLTAKGAALLVAPPIIADSGESPDGSSLPEDEPSRVTEARSIFDGVVAAHPASTTLVDLGSILTPGGAFAASVDGQVIRCPDGIHVTPAAGHLVAPLVFDAAWRAGAAHRAANPGPLPTTPALPPAVPAWSRLLKC